MAERKSKNNLSISGVSCIWMCKELICLLPSLLGALNPHQQLPQWTPGITGQKNLQGEPGFITGLWWGWERRNTSSSWPEVKKNHQRGGPAVVCPVEHPSVFYSMERSSQHMFGVAENTTKESRSLGHPLSTFCQPRWEWKRTLLCEGSFWRAPCSRSRAGCLFPHCSTHTGLQQLESFYQNNLTPTQRAFHRNESLIH